MPGNILGADKPEENFTFTLNLGFSFSFSLEKSTHVEVVKKKVSPSAVRSNTKRKEEVLKKGPKPSGKFMSTLKWKHQKHPSKKPTWKRKPLLKLLKLLSVTDVIKTFRLNKD